MVTPLQRQRVIRSFVQRDSRMTAAQQRALDDLMPRFGVPPGPIAFAELFARNAANVLEIGFGDGESLLAQACRNPDVNYLGIETYRPGIGHLLLRLHELAIDNVRVVYADAVQVLSERIADQSLATIQIFFPDPWPKKRHHKRRLIQPVFGVLLARKLKPGGCLHVATDWRNYAEHILRVLSAIESLRNCHEFCTARAHNRPTTKFEQRGQALGHGVWDFVFQRR